MTWHLGVNWEIQIYDFGLVSRALYLLRCNSAQNSKRIQKRKYRSKYFLLGWYMSVNVHSLSNFTMDELWSLATSATKKAVRHGYKEEQEAGDSSKNGRD